MSRPKPSGTPVASLDDIKGRAVRMTQVLPAGRERRDLARREAIVRRIEAEFRDMPGLILTLKQACRFLGVDEAACARILTALVQAGVLRRSVNEYYSRREPGH